jgi:hypothetical protein
VTRRLVTLFLIAFALGCGRVEEQQLLPWFRVKTHHRTDVGILSLGWQSVEFFVKSGWRWKKLDVYGGATIVLNPTTVAFYSNGQLQIIHRGETTFRPVCGASMSSATIARKTEAIDCVQTLEGPIGVPKKIRWHRVTAFGRLLNDETLDVESPERVFMNPSVKFYDDNELPYFVTLHDWPYQRPDCAIVTADRRSIRGPADMTIADCSSPQAWSKVLQRRLH